jgi:hypothetical protein
VCACVGRACVCASTGTLFTGQLRALGASTIGQGDAAVARCISRITASTLAAWQFSARQCWVQCSHLRGVPQRRVAARLASVAGYAGPDESVLSSRRQNLSGASYKSVRLSPIIIGIVVSVCHAEIFDFGQLLRT